MAEPGRCQQLVLLGRQELVVELRQPPPAPYRRARQRLSPSGRVTVSVSSFLFS